ncbi:DnaJ-class molecular chaperone [Hoeflea halophila]|uniref:DnaJ-class molecular chaperone n=1 Tax=Hoeflea halophila TaxID=714899 RepID=A0A286IC30_9HYPH|nr:DnaJ C-terminal domain-containing protein [Hoeflea halophila]SOE17678.1 DnaJ-class molecular chaperone [Hoeflea halophila]
MRSPYTVLGVSSTAKAGDIKSAYRQLAKIWHPDQNPDDPQAGTRFAEIAHAYKLLIDPELRMRFDNGHIDARGRRQKPPARGFSPNPFKTFKDSPGAAQAKPRPTAANQSSDALDEAKFEDMVVHIFGDAAAKNARERSAQSKDQTGQRTKTDAPGIDEDPLTTLDTLFKKWKSRYRPKTVLPVTQHQIEISLETAFAGHEDEIVFGENETVSYEIPAGTVDGTEIIVASPNPQMYGDTVVTVRHQKHARLRSSGSDLHGDHPIELAEAVLGGSFVYEGIDGPLRIDVPEWSGSDTVLEIKNKGLPTRFGKRGKLHVHLRVMLPEKPDPHLKDLMRSSKKAWYL